MSDGNAFRNGTLAGGPGCPFRARGIGRASGRRTHTLRSAERSRRSWSPASLLDPAAPHLGAAAAEGLLHPLDGIVEAHRREPREGGAEANRDLPLGRLVVEAEASVRQNLKPSGQAHTEPGPDGPGERSARVGAAYVGGQREGGPQL